MASCISRWRVFITLTAFSAGQLQSVTHKLLKHVRNNQHICDYINSGYVKIKRQEFVSSNFIDNVTIT